MCDAPDDQYCYFILFQTRNFPVRSGPRILYVTGPLKSVDAAQPGDLIPMELKIFA